MGTQESGDQNDVIPPKSPWKTSAVPPPQVTMEVSDSDSWPALSDANQQQRTKNSNASSAPISPAAKPSATVEQKFHGRGNIRSPRRPHHGHQNKGGPKHSPNDVAPNPVLLPYYPPAVAPVFNTMYPVAPIPVPGYTYPLSFPGPMSKVDAHLVNSESNGAANGSFMPPLQTFSGAHDSNGKSSNEKEHGGLINSSVNNQRPGASSNTIHLQQPMAARPLVRPPFFGPVGYLDGSNFQGPPGAIYYYPAPPPAGSMRVPYPPVLVPYYVNPGVPVLPSPVLALRANVVRQIEYYFSDVNLRSEHHMISLMDDQGWIPISDIANFNMVKKMNVDIPFILDALQTSETIEVQGEKIRRRNDWTKWIPASSTHQSSSLDGDAIKNDNSNQNERTDQGEANKLPSTSECYDESLTLGGGYDEEDEVIDNDHDVERLIIVTQNNSPSGGPGEESKTISSELASAINDGLYFYEQELESKQSQCNHGDINIEGRDETSKCSSSDVSVVESSLDNSNTGNNCQVPAECHRKQIEGSSKQHSIGKQRLFPRNFEACGSGRNSLGVTSESPPDDFIGFFFGTTPDSQGICPSKLSASPHSNLEGISPPVGSLPKPFPPFQHPSHKLLEENGFKQQKYKKYRKRCLSERKKMGIGHSKEMNKLYWFWSHFLRNRYIPPMYEEFLKFALEDADAGYNYGMECLFRFYSYGLEIDFKENLYDDFEQLTLDFYKRGNLYGLEKYWALHHYRKCDESLKKHPELDRLLKEEYRTIDDFPRKAKSVAANC